MVVCVAHTLSIPVKWDKISGMSKEHLNYEQMSLTRDQFKSLTSDKEMRDLLGHVVDHSPTPVIGRKTQGKHIQLYFKDDGIVTMAGTKKDKHSIGNAESQIRKSLASHGFEFPTMNQVKKQKKKQKDEPEEPPTE